MPIPAGGASYVWPPTAAEVDAELNLDADTSSDGELAGFIDAIVRVVEEITGPISSTTYTEMLDGGGPAVMLRRYPVLSVTSVTEYLSGTGVTLTEQPLGSTYTGNGYVLEADIGRLRRSSNATPVPFAAGLGNVVVSYTAGRASVPPNVRLGALELIRLHWKPQRSGGPSTLGTERAGDDDYTAVTILGFYVPGKVLELLQPDRHAPRVG